MRTRNHKVIAALTFSIALSFLVMAGPAAIAGEQADPVEVQSVQVVNDTVFVDLLGCAQARTQVLLVVTVMLEGGQVNRSTQEVVVQGQDGATASASFGSDVSGVMAVGFTDEDSPF